LWNDGGPGFFTHLRPFDSPFLLLFPLLTPLFQLSQREQQSITAEGWHAQQNNNTNQYTNTKSYTNNDWQSIIYPHNKQTNNTIASATINSRPSAAALDTSQRSSTALAARLAPAAA
jgi:hypothetical protein